MRIPNIKFSENPGIWKHDEANGHISQSFLNVPNLLLFIINEALTNINIVKTYGDSLVSSSSSLKINTSCVGKTSAVTDVMGEPEKEAPTNAVKDHGHSSVSVDLLTTT